MFIKGLGRKHTIRRGTRDCRRSEPLPSPKPGKWRGITPEQAPQERMRRLFSIVHPPSQRSLPTHDGRVQEQKGTPKHSLASMHSHCANRRSDVGAHLVFVFKSPLGAHTGRFFIFRDARVVGPRSQTRITGNKREKAKRALCCCRDLLILISQQFACESTKARITGAAREFRNRTPCPRTLIGRERPDHGAPPAFAGDGRDSSHFCRQNSPISHKRAEPFRRIRATAAVHKFKKSLNRSRQERTASRIFRIVCRAFEKCETEVQSFGRGCSGKCVRQHRDLRRDRQSLELRKRSWNLCGGA